MGQAYAARKQDQETVEEEAKSLRLLFDLALTLRSLRSCSLVLTPLEALFRLNGIDDIRDDSAAHRHRNPRLLASLIFPRITLALSAVSIVMVTANHIDLTA